MKNKILIMFTLTTFSAFGFDTVDINLDKDNKKWSDSVKEEIELKLEGFYSDDNRGVLKEEFEETNWVPISGKKDCTPWQPVSLTEEVRECKIKLGKIQKSIEFENNLTLNNMNVNFETKEEIIKETRIRYQSTEIASEPPETPPIIENCSAKVDVWGSCSGSLSNAKIGEEIVINNSISRFVGTARFRCANEGNWVYVMGTCGATATPPPSTPKPAPKKCYTETVRWGSCSGLLPTLNETNSISISNSREGFAGTAQYRCNEDGSWFKISENCTKVSKPEPKEEPKEIKSLLIRISKSNVKVGEVFEVRAYGTKTYTSCEVHHEIRNTRNNQFINKTLLGKVNNHNMHGSSNRILKTRLNQEGTYKLYLRCASTDGRYGNTTGSIRVIK